MAINDSSRGLAVDAHHQQPTPQIMSTPPTPTRIRREDRDTGFPEPFGDNFNTTLPHPDADLSPNATISADDLSVEQAMKRRRLSMLTKHRRTVSQASSIGGASISGVLSIMSAYMPATPVTDAHHIVGGGSSTGPQHQLPDAPGGPASDSSAASKASASYARGAGGGGYDTPPLSPSSGQGTSVDGERRGSGGRLRRWLSSRR